MFGRKRIKYLEDKLEYAEQLLRDSEFELRMYKITMSRVLKEKNKPFKIKVT